MTLALVALPILLFLLGFPIFVVLLGTVTLSLLVFADVPLAALHQNLFAGVNGFSFLAVPFFIYAGELMGRSSVAERLVGFVRAGVGSAHGGLAVTTVGTSALFGAISGASSATVATVGRVMHPAMLNGGYPPEFAAGLVTAVGAIDIIIPPSIPMIIYGIAASESIPRLYAAGVLPGLLMAGMLAAYVSFYARRRGIPRGAPFSLRALGRAAARSAWGLGAPAIVLGGIYGGVFSPTEAAAVTCIYAAVVARFAYGELGLREVLSAARATALMTGQILIVLACANALGWLLTIHQVAAATVATLVALKLPVWLLLLAINLVLLLSGCVLDPISAILLLSPMLLPLVRAAGVDSVHFGIIVMVNLAIGLFHPPFGVNIFVAQTALGIPVRLIYRGILPFLAVYLVALGVITYVPVLSTIGVRFFLAH